jgi:outer membrane autotransporter protein
VWVALTVRSQNEDRLRASLGGQLDWAMSSTVKPYVRAFWGSELEDDDSITSANFAAGGAPFVVRDAGLESPGYVLGIGVNVATGGNFGAALSYDRTDGDTCQTDMLQAKMLWRL